MELMAAVPALFYVGNSAWLLYMMAGVAFRVFMPAVWLAIFYCHADSAATRDHHGPWSTAWVVQTGDSSPSLCTPALVS